MKKNILYNKSITKAQKQGVSVIEYTENKTTQRIRAIREKASSLVLPEHSVTQNR